MAKFRCKKCENFVTNEISEYRNHFDKEHKTLINCLYCDYQAPYKSWIVIHTNAKHTKILLNCEHCTFKCTQKSSLTRHTRKVHEKLSKKCPSCVSTFCTEKGYLNHINTAHVKLLLCTECNFSTYIAQNYRQHTIQHNAMYKCNDCPYYTNNNSNLTRHIQAKHLLPNKFQCPMCFYSTNRNNYLNKHVKTHHASILNL